MCLYPLLSRLEVVSELTTEAFVACLGRFNARRGKSSVIWSNNGTNFDGAANEVKQLVHFLNQRATQEPISDFISSQIVEWRFIPQHAPHFGGLWDAAVKSMKKHLRSHRRGEADLWGAIHCCSTDWSLLEQQASGPPGLVNDDEGLEVLTPGHFLIDQALEALPDSSLSYISRDILLNRWELCQAIVRHFWKRWSTEYVTNLNCLTKWFKPSRNIGPSDLILLQEESIVPTKACLWPGLWMFTLGEMVWYKLPP